MARPAWISTGTIAAGSQVPTGDAVAITLDGVTQDAVVGSDGSFSTTFTTTSLHAERDALRRYLHLRRPGSVPRGRRIEPRHGHPRVADHHGRQQVHDLWGRRSRR